VYAYVPDAHLFAVVQRGRVTGFPGWISSAARRHGIHAARWNVTLTYAWQQMSGPSSVVWPRSAGRWPPQPTMSGQNTSQPTVSGMVAGSYTFQLTVTDSSRQSSVCTVNHGSVVTDDNGVVIPNNPAVDTLLGPMIRYGANSWPWFDDRHKADADVQIAKYGHLLWRMVGCRGCGHGERNRQWQSVWCRVGCDRGWNYISPRRLPGAIRSNCTYLWYRHRDLVSKRRPCRRHREKDGWSCQLSERHTANTELTLDLRCFRWQRP